MCILLPAETNGTYLNTGAVADLYTGLTKTARHFFDAASKPTFIIFDPSTGAIQGTVQGSVKAKAARQRQQDDGGFGSVDALLLTAHNGTGENITPAISDLHTSEMVHQKDIAIGPDPQNHTRSQSGRQDACERALAISAT